MSAALTATANIEQAIGAAVAATQTAQRSDAAAEAPTNTRIAVSATPTARPATKTPTRPRPTPTPTFAFKAPTIVLPTPYPTPAWLNTPPALLLTPTEEPPVNRYAREGYYPYDKPELAIMIHPRLTFSDRAVDLPTDVTLYSFVDFNAEYLYDELTIYKDFPPMRSIADAEMRAWIDRFMQNSAEHVSAWSIIATDETSIGGHPGRIGRYTFTSDGDPCYGVMMIFSYDEWLYRFDIYGRDYEHDTIEQIVSSIYGTVFLRGPSGEI